MLLDVADFQRELTVPEAVPDSMPPAVGRIGGPLAGAQRLGRQAAGGVASRRSSSMTSAVIARVSRVRAIN
jgi:hypothetical protein